VTILSAVLSTVHPLLGDNGRPNDSRSLRYWMASPSERHLNLHSHDGPLLGDSSVSVFDAEP